MRALLLPIKDLSKAKQRLAEVLASEERFALAQAMLEDTARAVAGLGGAAKVFVVTMYEPAMDLAARNGWEVLREEQQISESASVDFASRVCEERGVSGLLRLPCDLPLIQPEDIEDLLAAACHAPGMVVVPSRDGSGTNAILRTPPTLFRSHFGKNSLAKHLREAEQAGAQIILQRNARVELDVDDEGDLRALLEEDLRGTATGEWLERSGVAARVRGRAAAG